MADRRSNVYLTMIADDHIDGQNRARRDDDAVTNHARRVYVSRSRDDAQKAITRPRGDKFATQSRCTHSADDWRIFCSGGRGGDIDLIGCIQVEVGGGNGPKNLGTGRQV